MFENTRGSFLVCRHVCCCCCCRADDDRRTDRRTVGQQKNDTEFKSKHEYFWTESFIKLLLYSFLALLVFCYRLCIALVWTLFSWLFVYKLYYLCITIPFHHFIPPSVHGRSALWKGERRWNILFHWMKRLRHLLFSETETLFVLQRCLSTMLCYCQPYYYK